MFKSWFNKKKKDEKAESSIKAGPSASALTKSSESEPQKKSQKVFELSESEKGHFMQLYCFLLGSHWRVPIESFMDEYCIIFDDEEENKLEYTTYHKVAHF
jgi:The ARF-like 2 binding protein BART